MIEKPADVPDHMAPAWVGMIRWAIGNPDIRKQFEADSGIPCPATSGIARMIDEATGLPEKYVTEFAAWAHKNLWGRDDDAGSGVVV